MADRKTNRWNWEVSGFEPRKSSSEETGHRTTGPLLRRYSISTAQAPELSKQALASKVLGLKEKVKVKSLFLFHFTFTLQSIVVVGVPYGSISLQV